MPEPQLTLGDIAKVLQDLADRGAVYEAVLWVAENKVQWP